jgi:hypothetical protein
MTTDADAAARAARVEALRRRRVASTSATSTGTGCPRRRRHAASRARIVAGVLSAATSLGLVGIMAGNAGSTPSATPATHPVSLSPAQKVTVVHRPATTLPATATPRPRPTAAPPVTVS